MFLLVNFIELRNLRGRIITDSACLPYRLAAGDRNRLALKNAICPEVSSLMGRPGCVKARKQESFALNGGSKVLLGAMGSVRARVQSCRNKRK